MSHLYVDENTKNRFSSHGIEINRNATGNVKTTCPKCKHKNKSLSVHIEKGIWKCHYCQHTGSLNGKANGKFPYSYGSYTKWIGKDKEGKRIAYWEDNNGGKGLNGTKPGLYQQSELQNAIDRGSAVFLVEGESDSDTLRSFGLTAVTNPSGSGEKWKIADTPLANAKEIILLWDNDKPGIKRKDVLITQLRDIGIPFRVIDLPGSTEGGDITDWLRDHTFEQFDEIWEKSELIDTSWRTASYIDHLKLPPIRYIVKGLIPEGLALFAGKPKMGKSVFALQMALAVASGGMLASCWRCEQRDVLYLDLEGNVRRSQRRLNDLEPDEKPDNLFIAYEWPRIGDGACEKLDRAIKAKPNIGLIIIDVLERIRPARDGHGNAYAEDYRALEFLQDWVKIRPGLAVLVVHHQRKMAGDDSVYDSISGTLGLSGAADTLLILERKNLGGIWQSTFHGIGRDTDENVEVAANLKRPFGWAIQGDIDDVALSKARQDVLSVLRDRGTPAGMAPGELARATGMDRQRLYILLRRMGADGQVEGLRQSRGGIRYRSHTSGDQWDQHDHPDQGD